MISVFLIRNVWVQPKIIPASCSKISISLWTNFSRPMPAVLTITPYPHPVITTVDADAVTDKRVIKNSAKKVAV